MRTLTKIFLLAFLFRLILSFLVWHPDVNNHIDWGIRFWQYGPGKFYSANVWSFTWPNQPPGSIYIFVGIRKLFEAVFSLFWFINLKVPAFPSNIMFFFETNLYPALLKLPSIAADLGIAYLIYKFLKDAKKEKLGILGAAIFLFNPVIWYNSSLWGQTDSVVNLFAILAFYLLLKKKLDLSFLAFALSLYIKASLLIFLPIFLTTAFKQKYKVVGIVKAMALPAVVVGLATLPFSGGDPFGWLYELFVSKVFREQLQVITANAFNIWAFLTGIHERPHAQILGPLSYKSWGIILFALSYIPALVLVFKKQSLKSVMWSLSLASFGSFMFLTNMHERYLYPLFPAFTILAVLEAKLLPVYWAVSGINLINLYNFWWVPKIRVLVDVLSWRDRLLPRILGFGNFLLLLILYFNFSKHPRRR
ncbi:MAG: hypothetical protein ACOYT7_03905 [Patescibacteria group bacterium]